MSHKDFVGLPFASQPSSPGIMSPPSPFIDEGYSRSSEDGFVVPRLRTLEAQAQVHSTEIALLRQLGEDLGSWRYRVDSASTQTAHLLHHLNKEMDTLKSQLAELSAEDSESNREAVDTLVSQMHTCYKDLQDALGRLNEGPTSPTAGGGPAAQDPEGIAARLQDVEVQLAATQALLTTQDDTKSAFQSELSDVRASLAETGAIAKAAAADAAMAGAEAVSAANAANSTAHEIYVLSDQVQALRLGLEVVEQSLEELDVTDTLATLRSRVDDLDAGIEHAGDEALAQIAEVATTVEDLRREISRTDEIAAVAAERACRVEAAVAIIGDDVAALRRDVRQRDLMDATSLPSLSATPATTAPASPATSTAPFSDPRLKAAVHTLSDGYRSLHRAMSLMYEEQSEVANRIATVGIAAQASQIKYTKASPVPPARASRIRALNLTSLSPLSSHPVALTSRTFLDSDSDRKGSRSPTSQVAELKVLVAGQAAEASRHQRRADAMETEIAEMKRLLATLAPAPVEYFQPGPASSPASSEEEFYQAVSEHEENFQAAIVENSLVPQTESSIAPLLSESAAPDSSVVSLDLSCDEGAGYVAASLTHADVANWAQGGAGPKPSPARCSITRASAAAAKHTQQNGNSKPVLSSPSQDKSQIAANWPYAG